MKKEPFMQVCPEADLQCMVFSLKKPIIFRLMIVKFSECQWNNLRFIGHPKTHLTLIIIPQCLKRIKSIQGIQLFQTTVFHS